MTVYENYNVIAFRSCNQIFTVYRVSVQYSDVATWKKPVEIFFQSSLLIININLDVNIDY